MAHARLSRVLLLEVETQAGLPIQVKAFEFPDTTEEVEGGDWNVVGLRVWHAELWQ